MTELFEKSLNTLELPAILRMLAGEAVCDAAKAAALTLIPLTDIHEARYLLDETSAAATMTTVKGVPPLSAVRDVRGGVKRADLGGVLSTQELLDVAQLLRVSAGLLSYSSNDTSEKSAIDYLFYALRSNKYLESKISGAIVGVDEFSDNASPELYDIRRHMRLAGDKIRGSLNKIITSQTYAKALQEPLITMKNNRYVVPVKADQKSAVPGLVHDVSSSGSTLFIEPLSVVQTNNEIRELLAKEKQEIERILAELSAEVAAHGEDIISDFETVARLDLIFAKAKLSGKLNAHAPELTEDGKLNLIRCRHPLLSRAATVPTDLRLGESFDTLVITGPNTGGKTVALKTLGLFCAMAQCGLHIPADSGSVMPVFEKILADIGDEQSIEQSLSTFSSHMTNIVKILAECGEKTLLLFDELGAGTDPTEGAALAISIIEYCRGRGALTAATTHYSELKIYALNAEGAMNASCEFNVETLQPTYRLLIGVPGRSNAFAISRRLGLSEEVITQAMSLITNETASFEDAVDKLEATRRELEDQRDEAQRLKSAAERDARLAEKYRADLEREREKASELARREAQKIIDGARGTADTIFEEIRELRRRAEDENDFQNNNEARAEVLRKLNEAEVTARGRAEEVLPPSARPIAAGDTVRLNDLGAIAEVMEVRADGVLSLQAGSMKITAKENEVRLVEGVKGKNKPKNTRQISADAEVKLRGMGVSSEIDLRGMMADEAVSAAEMYLDSAHVAKLETVTIIHGKGTGALRGAIQAMLKQDPFVKSFRPGRYGEGENGVTVVEMR